MASVLPEVEEEIEDPARCSHLLNSRKTLWDVHQLELQISHQRIQKYDEGGGGIKKPILRTNGTYDRDENWDFLCGIKYLKEIFLQLDSRLWPESCCVFLGPNHAMKKVSSGNLGRIVKLPIFRSDRNGSMDNGSKIITSWIGFSLFFTISKMFNLYYLLTIIVVIIRF